MIDVSTILDIAEKTIALASVIAALTPTPRDDGVVSFVRKIVDFLAFNFGNAKNQK